MGRQFLYLFNQLPIQQLVCMTVSDSPLAIYRRTCSMCRLYGTFVLPADLSPSALTHNLNLSPLQSIHLRVCTRVGGGLGTRLGGGLGMRLGPETWERGWKGPRNEAGRGLGMRLDGALEWGWLGPRNEATTWQYTCMHKLTWTILHFPLSQRGSRWPVEVGSGGRSSYHFHKMSCSYTIFYPAIKMFQRDISTWYFKHHNELRHTYLPAVGDMVLLAQHMWYSNRCWRYLHSHHASWRAITISLRDKC